MHNIDKEEGLLIQLPPATIGWELEQPKAPYVAVNSLPMLEVMASSTIAGYT